MSKTALVIIGILCAMTVAYAFIVCIQVTDPMRVEIEGLIGQLSSDDADVCIRAQEELIDIGPRAIPFLKKHDNPKESKIRDQIRFLINSIDEAEMKRLWG